MSIEIKNECLVEVINHEEFISYLNTQSGGSSGSYDTAGNFSVTYTPPLIGRNEINVIYGKKNQIKNIVFSGNNLSQIKPFIEQSHRILQNKSEIGIHYSVLYSKGRPVKGFHRNAENKFQIIELPDLSLKPKALMDDHPFFIQYPYYVSGDTAIDAQRRSNSAKKWELFCIGILDGLITMPTQNRRWVWGIDENEPWTRIAQDGFYSSKEYQKDDLGFFISDKIENISVTRPDSYYNVLRTIGSEFMLPNNIDALISKFNILNKVDEEAFLRSSYWLLQSALTASSSLSYTALAFSLESLLPEAKKVKTCPTCKTADLSTAVRDSVSNQIRNLINEFTDIPDEQINKLFKRLYNLRSKIAHGDHIFNTDKSFSWGMNRQTLDESDNYQIMRNIVKVIIYNWFIRREE